MDEDESPLEQALARVIATTNFPTPTTWLREYEVPGLPFRLDFYCPEFSLGVEADGGGHAGNRGYDSFRDGLVIAKAGVTVIRFTGQEILYKPRRVSRRLEEEVRWRWLRSLPRYIPEPYPHEPWNPTGSSSQKVERQRLGICLMSAQTCSEEDGRCFICGDPFCQYHLAIHVRRGGGDGY